MTMPNNFYTEEVDARPDAVCRVSDLARAAQSQTTEDVKATETLRGKRACVLLFSHFPSDARPRRAAEALVRVGMEVDMICLGQSGRDARRETVHGVRVRRLPIRRQRGGKLGYFWQYGAFILLTFLILAKRALHHRYDIMHVHNMPDVLVFSALIPKLLGARIILDLHDPMPELMQSIYRLRDRDRFVRLLTRFERWSIGWSHLVLTPNSAFRDLFISRGCQPEKIAIVMNSPQRELFDPSRASPEQPAPASETTFKLMYHGLLVERHGLDIAIQAVDRLRNEIPGLVFHIFGERTPYMARMERMIVELGLTDHVLYHGYKPHAEIARALATVDLGVIPNRRSPFTELNMPTRIFENLAMGKAVIAPSTLGIREYFNDDQLLFFEPDNVESLAEAIKWAHDHPSELAGMVDRGRRVLGEHRWEAERTHFTNQVASLLRPTASTEASVH